MPRKYWTSEEVELLKEKYPTTTSPELMKLFGCSLCSVYNKAHSLGLYKTEAYLKEHGRHLDGVIGKATRFKPGQTPPNKGKKMPEHVYEKAAPTMFKKGQVPHNTKQDGAISIRTDKNGTKRPFIRVGLGKWVEMKNYVWEKEHGPIPKGHCVVVLDKNPFNYDLSNLICVTQAENMKRNTIHNYPEEIKTTIRTITKLKNKLESMAKNKLNDLRDHLFVALEKLNDEDVDFDVAKAKAICEVSKEIVDTAKLEFQIVRDLGGRTSPFFEGLSIPMQLGDAGDAPAPKELKDRY